MSSQDKLTVGQSTVEHTGKYERYWPKNRYMLPHHTSEKLRTAESKLKADRTPENLNAVAEILWDGVGSDGGEQDQKRAIELWTEAAATGDGDACAGLHEAYLSDAYRDLTKARQYAEAGAEAGNDSARESHEEFEELDALLPRADSGDPIAQYKLSEAYVRGTWVEKDEKRAFHYAKLAAAADRTNPPPTPQAIFHFAELQYRGTGTVASVTDAKQSYARAKAAAPELGPGCHYGTAYKAAERLEWIEVMERADGGDAAAQYRIASSDESDMIRFLFGNKERERRLHYAKLAATQPNPPPEVLHRIAENYSGHNFAFQCQQRLADMRVVPGTTTTEQTKYIVTAQFAVGSEYLRGETVRRDAMRAYHYLELARSNGSEEVVSVKNAMKESLQKVATAYWNGELTTASDKMNAYRLWQRAVRSGPQFEHSVGLFGLGLCALRGTGGTGTRDVNEAKRLLTLAKAAGYAEALDADATKLLTQLLTEIDAASARVVELKRKADAGDADSQFKLAREYHDGVYTPRDATNAFRYAKLAADRTNPSPAALNLLGALYYTGTGTAVDYARAFELFQRTVAAGDAVGHIGLGVCYQYGHDVPCDLAKAKHHFRSAGKSGESYLQPITAFETKLAALQSNATGNESGGAAGELKVALYCERAGYHSLALQHAKRADDHITAGGSADAKVLNDLGELSCRLSDRALALAFFRRSYAIDSAREDSYAAAMIARLLSEGTGGVKSDAAEAVRFAKVAIAAGRIQPIVWLPALDPLPAANATRIESCDAAVRALNEFAAHIPGGGGGQFVANAVKFVDEVRRLHARWPDLTALQGAYDVVTSLRSTAESVRAKYDADVKAAHTKHAAGEIDSAQRDLQLAAAAARARLDISQAAVALTAERRRVFVPAIKAVAESKAKPQPHATAPTSSSAAAAAAVADTKSAHNPPAAIVDAAASASTAAAAAAALLPHAAVPASASSNSISATVLASAAVTATAMTGVSTGIDRDDSGGGGGYDMDRKSQKRRRELDARGDGAASAAAATAAVASSSATAATGTGSGTGSGAATAISGIKIEADDESDEMSSTAVTRTRSDARASAFAAAAAAAATALAAEVRIKRDLNTFNGRYEEWVESRIAIGLNDPTSHPIDHILPTREWRPNDPTSPSAVDDGDSDGDSASDGAGGDQNRWRPVFGMPELEPCADEEVKRVERDILTAVDGRDRMSASERKRQQQKEVRDASGHSLILCGGEGLDTESDMKAMKDYARARAWRVSSDSCVLQRELTREQLTAAIREVFKLKESDGVSGKPIHIHFSGHGTEPVSEPESAQPKRGRPPKKQKTAPAAAAASSATAATASATSPSAVGLTGGGDWIVRSGEAFTLPDLMAEWNRSAAKRAGAHLVLTIDCCHSGGWVEHAKSHGLDVTIQASALRDRPTSNIGFTLVWTKFALKLLPAVRPVVTAAAASSSSSAAAAAAGSEYRYDDATFALATKQAMVELRKHFPVFQSTPIGYSARVNQMFIPILTDVSVPPPLGTATATATASAPAALASAAATSRPVARPVPVPVPVATSVPLSAAAKKSVAAAKPSAAAAKK